MAGKTASTETPFQAAVVLERRDQQRLLDIFSTAFQHMLSSEGLPARLQEIKQALFHRDFAAAFGSDALLEAYAARWSPTRALCYAGVLRGVRAYADRLLVSDGPDAQEQRASDDDTAAALDPNPRGLRMLAVGGCAAELVAFASLLRDTSSPGTLILLDSAPWARVVSLLQAQLTTPPPLSKYASAASKASNKPLLAESQLCLTFCQGDALSLTEDGLADMVGPRPLIVTLLFTLNELYADGGIGKTTRFLRLLGGSLPPGSLLLVVDSPGSYSEAAVGKDKKRYPMQWLLRHTLLEAETPGYEWEKLESHDSIWFRLPEGLSYPMQLENMRYQVHLYRIHKSWQPKAP